MKDGSRPIVAALQHQINNWRLVTYLQDRNRNRHREALTIPRPPRWTDTTLALASQIYNAQKLSLPTASHKVKHKYHNDASCPLCGQTDSQQHWITQCQAATLPQTKCEYIAQVKADTRREERAEHYKTVQWMKIELGIAVKHPQGGGCMSGNVTTNSQANTKT